MTFQALSVEPRASMTSLLELIVAKWAPLLLLASPPKSDLEALVAPLAGDALRDEKAWRFRIADVDRRLDVELEHAADGFPLARLVAHFRLSRLESDLLFLALLPEIDDRFGNWFAASCDSARRPTLGLALRMLFPEHTDRWLARSHLVASPLFRCGLLRGGDDLGLERSLVASAPVVGGAFGYTPDRLDADTTVTELPPFPRSNAPVTPLRPSLERVATELSQWIEYRQGGVVHITGDDARDARQVLERALSRFHRTMLAVSLEGPTTPETTMQEVLLSAVAADGAVGVVASRSVERLVFPAAWPDDVPLLLFTCPGCPVTLPAQRSIRRLHVPRARPSEQAAAWREALGRVQAEADVAVLANRTHLGATDIENAARLASDRARLAGRSAVHGDVTAALGELIDLKESAFARVERPEVEWSRIVVDRRVRGELEEMARRVQHRLAVQDEWGMGGGARGNGLIGLFHGESGTGKTLAVEALASRLGLPMLRVDLSRVVSKYIGETEKNLSGLFESADGFAAVLFFDEADSLYGSRTGVKDAHDRYANLETSYLLARLETFEGVAVLASNLLNNIDDAFIRRIDFVVHFARPTPPLQEQLWALHLPREHVEAEIDIPAVVRGYELVGGEIRNAALRAAFEAAARGTRINQTMLEMAARMERIKRGKAVRPLEAASR